MYGQQSILFKILNARNFCYLQLFLKTLFGIILVYTIFFILVPSNMKDFLESSNLRSTSSGTLGSKLRSTLRCTSRNTLRILKCTRTSWVGGRWRRMEQVTGRGEIVDVFLLVKFEEKRGFQLLIY